MNKEILQQELKKLLLQYLKEKPSRNIAQLSRETTICESTLRRLSNAQALPSAENILKLLTFLSAETRIHQLINLHPGEIADFLKKAFPQFVKQEFANVVTTFNMEDILQDFTSYLIIKRISHCDRVTRQDIQQLLGEVGHQKLQELISHQLVEINKQDELHFAHKEFSLSPTLIKKHSPRIMETFFKVENAVTAKAMARNFSESTTPEGRNLILDIARKASADIYRALKENPGEVPLYFICQVDTLNAQAEGEKNP